MDLDSLLAELDLTATGTPGTTAGATHGARAAPAGRAPQPPPPQQGAVSFDDLQGLMDDLTSETKPGVATEFPSPPQSATEVKRVESFKVSSPAPTAAPAKTQTAAKPKPKASSSHAMDDIDALVESLDATAKEAAATSSQSQGQAKHPASSRAAPAKPAAPRAAPAAPLHQAPPPQARPVSTADALDDLLGQLSSTAAEPPSSNANTQRNVQPVRAAPSPMYTNPPPAARPVYGGDKPKDELDGLLANLSTEMSRIDADTPTSRGVCGRCDRPITGEVIQAMGRMWHPEHFTCGSCKQPLGTSTFYESDGQPNCDRCWKSLYCPRCAHCDQPIADRCITALGKKWHADHFICSQCLQPLDGGFFERDGKPYCERDYYAAFSAKCAGCDQPIRGECINALGLKWHPDHFACVYCHKSFAGGAFFEYQGKPYCEAHYYQMTGSICGGCGKPVGTRSITALDKKWHPEHFVCAFCNNPLGGGSFKEQGGKAYCNACHVKLFG